MRYGPLLLSRTRLAVAWTCIFFASIAQILRQQTDLSFIGSNSRYAYIETSLYAGLWNDNDTNHTALHNAVLSSDETVLQGILKHGLKMTSLEKGYPPNPKYYRPAHLSTNASLPKPIFMLSLPKSGTTSVWMYFNCGRIPAAHHYTKTSTGVQKIGQCMYTNLEAHLPLLSSCGGYEVWTDVGIPSPCFYPSIHGLRSIATHYPNSTIILVVRNTEKWIKSLKKFNGGSVLYRWRQFCSFRENVLNESLLATFYNNHNERVRRFAKDHPTLTYVEVALESPATPHFLEPITGVPTTCWKHCLPTKSKCESQGE